MTTALVLSGGGAKGSFEVGAVRYLYNHQFVPDIICSTSVGSVNGLKLAEGEGVLPEQGLEGLEKIWLRMKSRSDMYMKDGWLEGSDEKIKAAVDNFVSSGDSGGIQRPTLLEALALNYLPTVAASKLDILFDLIDNLSVAHGMFNLGPIAATARLKVNPELLGSIKLRMATVGLQSGEIRYVTESGKLLADPQVDDPNAPQIDLISGMLASAAIPGIFDMQHLADDWYVDGGVRQVVPIEPAIRMGATKVFAVVAPTVLCPPPIPGLKVPLCSDKENDYSNKGLLSVVLRAATGIAIDQIINDNLYPHGGWGVPVLIIRPNFEVEETTIVDPGLIRINMAYGFMRAFDVLSQHLDPNVRAVLFKLSDQIAVIRRMIWDQENNCVPPNSLILLMILSPLIYEAKKLEFLDNQIKEIPLIRSLKNTLLWLINCRISVGGFNSLPPDLATWPTQWEGHQWDPTDEGLAISPWDAHTYGGLNRVPFSAENPQPVRLDSCPQFRFKSSANGNYIQSDYGDKGNFEMVVIQNNHFMHYWRNNDAEGTPWNFGTDITQATEDISAGSQVKAGGPSLPKISPVSVDFFRSKFDNILFPNCNFEAIVHMTNTVGNDFLVTYYREALTNKWVGPYRVKAAGKDITGVTGNPVMIQSDYGGDFEMVVIQNNHLMHYWRNNDDPQEIWNLGDDITEQTTITSSDPRFRIKPLTPISVSFFQSNFETGHNENFEIIVQLKDLAGNDSLATYSRDGATKKWRGPFPINVNGDEITNITGHPVMIQSDYGNNGNFEMVVIQKDHLMHYWRNNDDPQNPWSLSEDITEQTTITSSDPRFRIKPLTPISVSFFQSNFRGGSGNNGNFEILVQLKDLAGNDSLATYSFDAAIKKWNGPFPIRVDGKDITGVTVF